MTRLIVLIGMFTGGWALGVFSQNTVQQQRVFAVQNPDWSLSPKTGMNRSHWIDAARYLLEGAFSHVNDMDDPMLFPKQAGKSYPRDGKHTTTEMLEGLTRTLFIAAPLLKEEPNLRCNGIHVASYYRHQLGKLVDPNSRTYITPRAPNGGPSQILVEFGALSISLFLAEDVLWDPLEASVQKQLASTMLSYGDGPTIEMNWRFFNIYILSFFKHRGMEVNEALLESLVGKCLGDYVGEGWYTDSPYFDYYSMWGFQMYGVYWSEVFGRKHYPEQAQQFERNMADLVKTYPHMFGRDGRMNMWGRSISYRFGAASPFPLMTLLPDQSGVNAGWLRRISSATLKQFLEHPDFLQDRVPTLGFYGPFEPAVQEYSCRGSVYWMGKLFLAAFLLPHDSPFWTAQENDGDWETYAPEQVYDYFSPGSGTLVTNYPQIGASEIRAWCHSRGVGYYQGTENYNKLAYSTVFPWMADGKDGLVSMNYAVKYQGKWESGRMYTLKGYKDGVYRRELEVSKDSTIRLILRDKTLPNGILRMDQYVGEKDVELSLGHYVLPQRGKPILKSIKKIGKYSFHIIDNGEYQLALVPISGWDTVEAVDTEGLHPEAEYAATVSARTSVKGQEPTALVSLMLWKKSGEKWRKQDIPLLAGVVD